MYKVKCGKTTMKYKFNNILMNVILIINLIKITNGLPEPYYDWDGNFRGCWSGEYRCSGGNTCQSASVLCDGKEDCYYGDDEDNCVCTDQQFRCRNDRCIDYELRCNGVYDCSDRSDEAEIECGSKDLYTTTNRYDNSDVLPTESTSGDLEILNFVIVDKQPEVFDFIRSPDYSLENDQIHQAKPEEDLCYGYDCDYTTTSRYDNSDVLPTEYVNVNYENVDRQQAAGCESNEFECDINKCIPDYLKCNNERDCDDGTDEESCLAQSILQIETFELDEDRKPPVTDELEISEDQMILKELKKFKYNIIQIQEENKAFLDKIIQLCESTDQQIQNLIEIIQNKQ